MKPLQLRRQVIETLKVVESLAYTCEQADDLSYLLECTQKLATEFKSRLPVSNGLLLGPASSTESARRIKQKYHILRQKAKKYLHLQKQQPRGKTPGDSKYRNRVGRKAEKFKQVSLLTCVFALSLYNTSHDSLCMYIHMSQEAKKDKKPNQNQIPNTLPATQKPPNQQTTQVRDQTTLVPAKGMAYCTCHNYML